MSNNSAGQERKQLGEMSKKELREEVMLWRIRYADVHPYWMDKFQGLFNLTTVHQVDYTDIPKGEVLLLTTSRMWIIGDWYKDGWRTRLSEWVPDGDKKRLTLMPMEDVLGFVPLPDAMQRVRPPYEFLPPSISAPADTGAGEQEGRKYVVVQNKSGYLYIWKAESLDRYKAECKEFNEPDEYTKVLDFATSFDAKTSVRSHGISNPAPPAAPAVGEEELRKEARKWIDENIADLELEETEEIWLKEVAKAMARFALQTLATLRASSAPARVQQVDIQQANKNGEV